MQEANFTEIWNDDDVDDEEDGNTADGQVIPWQLRALILSLHGNSALVFPVQDY